MALTGLGYDSCTYRQVLQETMAPGMYYLGTPLPLRDACDGPAGRRTDADSELRGLPRQQTRCSEKQYSGGGPGGLHCGLPAPLAQLDRRMLVEDTRVSNPPSTMRGAGVNRWTPLCEQPQDHAIEPFSLTDDRRQAKDNYRPCGTAPMDTADIMPRRLGPDEDGPTQPEAVESFPAVPMLPDFLSCEAAHGEPMRFFRP
jgi:hypothetical protein